MEPDERLLAHIFRIIARAKHADSCRSDDPFIPPNENPERPVFTASRSLEQLFVGRCINGSHCSRSLDAPLDQFIPFLRQAVSPQINPAVLSEPHTLSLKA
jgi:hypothetical protein